MRRYLGEFLSDKRVVELPQVLWQLILQGPILTFRPKKSAAAYREIWNNELDESPLRTITREQTEKPKNASVILCALNLPCDMGTHPFPH